MPTKARDTASSTAGALTVTIASDVSDPAPNETPPRQAARSEDAGDEAPGDPTDVARALHAGRPRAGCTPSTAKNSTAETASVARSTRRASRRASERTGDGVPRADARTRPSSADKVHRSLCHHDSHRRASPPHTPGARAREPSDPRPRSAPVLRSAPS